MATGRIMSSYSSQRATMRRSSTWHWSWCGQNQGTPHQSASRSQTCLLKCSLPLTLLLDLSWRSHRHALLPLRKSLQSIPELAIFFLSQKDNKATSLPSSDFIICYHLCYLLHCWEKQYVMVLNAALKEIYICIPARWHWYIFCHMAHIEETGEISLRFINKTSYTSDSFKLTVDSP